MLSTPNGWTLTVFLPTANIIEVTMSVQSQLQTAEESVRQALINALAEGEDQYLTGLFNLLNDVRKLNKKVSNTIRTTDNTLDWAKRYSEYNFNLSSDYLDRPGGDLDALDNVFEFPNQAAGPTNIPGALGDDVISFGNISISTNDDEEGNITFS